MSNTVKQLGFIPTNRGEFDTTGQTRYYKDNVVQYRNGSYICTPVGYSSSNPTAYTTDAPYQDGNTELNPNWELMASVGLVDDEPIASSDNLVKSRAVHNIKQDVQHLGVDINGGEKAFTVIGTGAGVYVNLADIDHSIGDRIDFIFNEDISQLVIYSASASGLSTLLSVTDDGNNHGHFKMPNNDNIYRFSIRPDNVFGAGKAIIFVGSTKSGLTSSIDIIDNEIATIDNEIEAIEHSVDNINIKIEGGTLTSYYGGGSNTWITYSEINKSAGDRVDIHYDGNMSNLTIYDAVGTSLRNLISITNDGNGNGHFTLSVNNDINRLYVISDTGSFSSGTTLSVVNGSITGIKADIEANKKAIADANTSIGIAKVVSNVNASILYNRTLHDNGKVVVYNKRACTQFLEYNSNVSLYTNIAYYRVAFYDADLNFISLEDTSTFPQVPQNAVYFRIAFLNPDEVEIVCRYTIAVLKDNIKTINSQTLIGNGDIEVQEKLISGQNIKTINSLSILGSGNIQISGGGGQSDSNFIDVCNYGFSSENSPADNVTAFQSVLDGGNKTIYVTIPGIYELNQTLLIDSNTEIVFNKGVILKKVANSGYANVFRNRGAGTRTYTENITIKGLYIDANLTNNPNGIGTPYYGLRSHLGFACVKNLQVYDYTIVNTGDYGYGIQVNDCYKFILDGFNINGYKDGIHISSIEGFVIRNGVLCTSDDGIALNAGDWVASNCINGPIRNGLIENVIDEAYGSSQSGNFIRLHNGAWVEWQSGMVIQRGDHVISNGNLYKADCPYHATTPYRYRSTHQPTRESYVDVQDFGEVDIDNRAPNEHLRWILVKKGVSYVTADIQNVVIRNIVAHSSRRLTVMSTDGQAGTYSRCIYIDSDPQSPILPLSSYPRDIIKFENCDLGASSSIMSESVNIGFDIVMDEIHSSKHGISLGTSMTKLPGIISLRRFDFADNTDQSDISTASGIRVIAKESKKSGALANSVAGSMVCDTPVVNYPSTPVAGDMIIKDGAMKVYDGTNWS